MDLAIQVQPEDALRYRLQGDGNVHRVLHGTPQIHQLQTVQRLGFAVPDGGS